MPQEKSTIKYLDLAISYGFNVLVFSVPLIFLPWAKEWFAIPKVTFLRLGVIFILTARLLRQLFSDRIYFWRTRLDLPVLIFVFSAFASTLFSVHPLTSLLGKAGRYEGLTTIVAYAALFFVATQVFREPRKLNKLLDAAILAVPLIAAYGLLQYLGYDFVSGIQFEWEPNRSFSTLGNPVLLGGYLAMMLPLVLSKYLADSGLRGRFFYAGVFVVAFATLVTTFSRGAWVAAVAGLLMLVLIRRGKTKQLVHLVFVLLVVVVLVVAINYSKSSSLPEKNISIAERISSVSKTREGSIGSRLLIWRSALQMVAARPLLGWGPDAFHLAFSAFSSSEFVKLEGSSKRADNAHNYFLQLAATQGSFGLFVFVALLISFFWTGFRFLSSQKRGKNHCRDDPRGRPNSRTGTSPVPTRNPSVRGRKRTHCHTSETPPHPLACLLPLPTYYLYAGLLASIAGYVSYLLSGINSMEMGVIFWTLLGIVSVQAESKKVSTCSFSPLPRTLAVLGIIVVAVGLSFVSLRPLQADIRYARAEKLEETGLVESAIDEAEAALAANPYQDRYARYLGHLYLQEGDGRMALSSFLRAKKINPLEVDNSGRLAEVYIKEAVRGEQGSYLLADREFSYILKINPYSAVARSGRGFVDLARGRFEDAIKELRQAVELDPRDVNARIFLGMAYERMNKKKEAQLSYAEALGLDPKNKDAAEGLKRVKE